MTGAGPQSGFAATGTVLGIVCSALLGGFCLFSGFLNFEKFMSLIFWSVVVFGGLNYLTKYPTNNRK